MGSRAQARRFDEEYARFSVFRPRDEEFALADASNQMASATKKTVQVLMTEQEEQDILELMEEYEADFADVKAFETQLAQKLQNLEETNIQSVLESDSLVEDVIFQLDQTGKSVSELVHWMDDVHRGLGDIQVTVRAK